jgi:hypothetical protein
MHPARWWRSWPAARLGQGLGALWAIRATMVRVRLPCLSWAGVEGDSWQSRIPIAILAGCHSENPVNSAAKAGGNQPVTSATERHSAIKWLGIGQRLIRTVFVRANHSRSVARMRSLGPGTERDRVGSVGSGRFLRRRLTGDMQCILVPLVRTALLTYQ